METYVLRVSGRFDRTFWQRWSDYHAEGAKIGMHCERLWGQPHTERNFVRQPVAFQNRVAILNAFIALGIPVTDFAG